MATGKINSNTVDAQAAIAELVGLNANSFANQSVDFGQAMFQVCLQVRA